MTVPLTSKRIESFIRTAPPGKKVSDGAGMYLMLTPKRTPVWRIKYRHGGKEKVFAVGVYPDIGLKEARAERDQVKKLLAAGRDPVSARRVDKVETTAATGDLFGDMAADWLARRKKKWSKVHYDKSKRAIERDVLPTLAKLPIAEITPAMVAQVIEAIMHRGAIDTAGKVLQHVNGIFRLAQVGGNRKDNPADPVSEILPKRNATKHRPAVLEWAGLGDILRRAETARLSPAVRMGHRLCTYSIARIGAVVAAEWPEFDLDSETPMWVIPREKMKTKDREHDHRVILGPTITAELLHWRQVTGGRGFVLPSPKRKKRGPPHITRESIEKAYRETLELADKHTPHGWRSAFSTLANDDSLDTVAVDLALDHVARPEVARAYDRGERLKQRVKLMTWWDEQLAKAQRGADVVQLRGKVSK